MNGHEHDSKPNVNYGYIQNIECNAVKNDDGTLAVSLKFEIVGETSDGNISLKSGISVPICGPRPHQ